MFASRHLCPKSNSPLRALLTLLLLIAWTVCSSVTVDSRVNSSSSCPDGWALWSAGKTMREEDPHDSASTMWCVQTQNVRVAPIEANEVCANIFGTNPQQQPQPPHDGWNGFAEGLIPQAISVHSHEQNLWLEKLLEPFFGVFGEVVTLGGAAGFGDIVWWDGSSRMDGASPYTHFDPSEDWETRSGCIAMQPNGFWRLVDCMNPQRPFLCAFTLHSLTEGNNIGSSNDGVSSSSSGGGEPVTTAEPSLGGPSEGSQQPTHPPGPHPLQYCLDGWLPFEDKCYRLYAELNEDNEEGMNQQLARSFCGSIHPRIVLTAVGSAGEAAFLGLLVQNWVQDRLDDLSHIEVHVGGIFTLRGSVGVWYEDALLYGEKDYAASSPSSPRWPTDINRLYSNWGAGEPKMPFGCVAITSKGTWTSVDCRLSLPFVCAYLNDGSVIPDAPNIDHEDSSGPSEASDSNDFDTTTATRTTIAAPQAQPEAEPQEMHCMDDWVYFQPTNRCFRVFTDRSVSAADLEQHCGRFLFGSVPVGIIHAATITSVEESAFAGQLVAESGFKRALVGVSYTERGAAGLYLDGATSWAPDLARSLWAVDQPARDRGCVVVDAAGAWYHSPCGAGVSAYACAYRAEEVHPLTRPAVPTDGRTTPPTTTTTPTTATTTTEAPSNNESWPLERRITALSGAVHLVVAAETLGTYTVTGAGGPTDGLLVMFAPDLSEVLLSVGWDDLVVASPCGRGYKKQEYIFPVKDGVVKVTHSNETMRGRVCVSDDGVHYVPAGNLTFEVVDVALHGFIPRLSPQEEEGKIGKGKVENVDSSSKESILVAKDVGICMWSSGALQLVLRRRDPYTGAKIRWLRLSSSSDCTSGHYAFARERFPVIEKERGHFFITYELANVLPTRGANLDRLQDPAENEERTAAEFYVCVAAFTQRLPLYVMMNTSEKEEWNQDSFNGILHPTTDNNNNNNNNNGNNNNNNNDNVVHQGKNKGNMSSYSCSVGGQSMWVYTLVPHLRVYLTPPHVVVRGMWALPPSALRTNGPGEPLVLGPSAKTLLISQFSSPVIVFDGEGLREGMTLLLSQKEGECHRYQPTSRRSTNNFTIPAALDTLVAVSTVASSLRGLGEGGSNDAGRRRVMFAQLNLNHTGMWGMDLIEESQTWHLCFAYTPISKFIPLVGVKITVNRARVSAITTYEEYGEDMSGSNSIASPHLQISVGFSGMLRLWGLDVHMWSVATINTAEIAFERVPPGNSRIADQTFQCSDTSFFYQQRSLGIVNPHNIDPTTTMASSSQQQHPRAAMVVIPPWFLNDETTRRMQVCLSVPLPFHSDHRVFTPTMATVDVRTIELYFIGPYAAHFPTTKTDTRLTLVEVAENVNDLVLPLFGYGLRDDMLLFLSEESCYSVSDEGEIAPVDASDAYVDRISRMNFTIMRPYDVPRKYRQKKSTHDAAIVSDLLITLNETHTSTSVADLVFGKARSPLFLCLYAPGTRRMVYPLGFRFVVGRPYVKSIRMAGSLPLSGQDGETVVVAYASFVDLLVEGFGLHEGETAFVPAVDCSNASSFLWHSPVRTAGVPSIIMEKKNVGGGTRYCSIHPPLSSSFSPASAPSRYVNPMTSMSSWFLSLTQAHTARIGAIEPVDNTITRFQWCVRYRDVDAADPTGATEWRRGFVPTGIPYQLIIPYTDGFLFGDTTTKNITRKTRHPTLGMWERIQLIGPLINHTFTLGNPLFIFLAEHFAPCKKLRKYPINTSSSDRFITAVNGTTIILPKLLSSTGSFKLCASAIYPDQQSSDEGTEAALQFFELKDLRIELVDPVYAIFSLNRTDYVTVEQGREWTLPISGSGLSTLALVRFRPVGANCSTPMPQGLEDVIVRNVFEGLTLFGEKVAISTDPQNELNGIGGHHYIVIGRSLLQGLSIQEYMLCFKPDRSTPWMSSSILLNVIEHVRRPTYYSYFNADGSNDVVSVAASPPTKIALEWLTHEKDTTHIVGAVGREVSLALWCRGEAGNNNTSALLVPCGNQRRIMLVRPLDSDADGGDPCFVDFESDPLETVRGPYVINDGILTIPREVSRSMSFYPNRTQPWIMCLETASERWRKPIYPVLKLQFATTAAVGFRHSPDNASNTTALFFGMTNSADYGASTGDRTGAEGNKTLVVHVEDTSKVFYLNGYGIQRGFMMRFGLHCDADDGGDNIASVDVDGSHGRAARVAELQGLNNILLYDEPLTLEDDHGVFLLPSTHFTRLEERAPMCLSTDGGRSYMRTNLSLQVLPSQLRRDVPADEARISELAFRHTLVVPRMSKGTVNLSELSSDNVEGSLFTIGVQVLLSSVCYMNRENLPIITVSVPNTITLIEAHTQLATKNRLHICVRMPGDVGASYGEDQNGGAGGNLAFRSSGLFFYVLNLTVTSASLHANIPNIVAEQNGIRQLVVRRGNESMMLFVTIKPGKYENSTIDVPHDTANACSMEEQYINLLNTPGVLALFRLAKFRLGKPCSVPDPHEPEATAASLSALTATFVNNTIHIATPEGSDAVSFAVPLHTSRNKAVEPWLPSSLCFSVDGGRHYLSVGISYVSVSWAPTLRVQFSMLTEEPDGEEDGRAGEVGNNESILSTVVHMFEQASFFGRLVDTRYHTTTSSSLQDPLLSRYLNEFTTDVLWSGFLKNEGFVSGGKLYLPAITINNNNNNNNNKNDVNGELFFLANYRQENIPTGLVVQVEPISFHCIGDTPTAFQQVHHQSAGWLMPIANSCGRSVQSGTIIRFVDERVDSCSAPEVDYAYAMDAFIMKPRKWMGGGGTSASTALQIPTSIGYVSDGRYKLCLRKSLPHHFGREAVFMDTSVVVEVSSSLDVDELSGVRQGALAVFQGSETELTLRGSVVPFVNNILIALLPVKADVEDPTTVCETLSILLENHSINMKLSTLWKRVTDVFTLRLRPADLLPTLSPAVYSLCYSINEGISFHLAGKDAAQPLQLIALPPTVLGPATTTTQGMYNPSRVTATAVHLVRFFDNDSSSSSPLDPSSLVQTSFFADRPPSYYYSACLCFEGNGIGALSGRNVSGAVRALAVAVLRTDLFGEVCNGVNLASEFGADISEHYNPLAVPVFIIDARSGCLWDHVATTRNTDGTNYNYNRSNNNDNNDRNEDYNDDAILRSEWLMNTASLRKAGGLSAEVLLGKVSTQRERLQRLSASYLICTSVDGKHFYSANIPLRTDNSTPAWESARLSSLVTASPRESLAPLKDVSRIPLVLRVDPTVSGSYFARDLAVSLHIVVRPCLPAVRSSLELESSAGSLVRFQAAAAQLLRIDPAIIVVRLSRPRAAPPAHITYTLSLSLLTDAHVADDNYNDGGGGDYVAKGTLTPSPELLLRYATLLRSSDVQASLLSTLLPPALREAETVTVRAPYINFTFGTGVDLHAALQQNSHELPNEPPEEKIWRDKFAAIPHATLIAEVVPDGGKSHSSRKVTWLAPLFLLLFPICIVLASVYVYKRFLVFRPMERRHGGRQEEEEIRHHETLT